MPKTLSQIRRISRQSAAHRSKYEDTVIQDLVSRKIPHEYETIKLTYVKESTYKPDIILPNGICIELKGYFDPQARTKMKLVKQQHPDVDIRLLFMADGKLNRKNPNSLRYSQWAERHGYKWATGNCVPQAWIDEQPTKETAL